MGAVQARYVHGANVDEVLAKVTATGTTFYHRDALGSTIALTDSGGNVVERYSYDVFGAPTIRNSANVITVSAFGNRFLFTGREWISEIALYDYRNRIYSPVFGRFLQTDPIRFMANDVNLYRYVRNSPTRMIDTFGLAGEDCPPVVCPDDPPDGDPDWSEQSGFWGTASEIIFHDGLNCYREETAEDSLQCCYSDEGSLTEGDIDEHNPNYDFWKHVRDVFGF